MNQEESRLLKDVKIKVDLMYGALIGDPLDQDKPGAMLRLGRAEQSLKNINKYIWILLTTLTVAMGTLIVRLLV